MFTRTQRWAHEQSQIILSENIHWKQMNDIIEKLHINSGYVIGHIVRRSGLTIDPDSLSRHTSYSLIKNKQMTATKVIKNEKVFFMKEVLKNVDHSSPFYHRIEEFETRSRRKQHKRKQHKKCVYLKVVPVDEQYSTIFTRLESFKHWSSNSSVSSIKLVDAGFFCVDASTEKCKCFSCGLTIAAIEFEGKTPFDVHKTKRPSCEFIQQIQHNFPPPLYTQRDKTATSESIENRFQSGLNLTNHHPNTNSKQNSKLDFINEINSMQSSQNRRSEDDLENDEDVIPITDNVYRRCKVINIYEFKYYIENERLGYC